MEGRAAVLSSRLVALGLALAVTGCASLGQLMSPLYAARARAQLDAGHFREAAALAKRALELEERAHPPDHPHLVSYATTLAMIYVTEGRLDESEALLRRALAISEAARGGDDVRNAPPLIGLAMVEQLRSRFGSARVFAERAQAIQIAALGERDEQVATTAMVLSQIHELRGDLDAADTELRFARSVFEERRGTDHAYVANVIERQAAVAAERGNYAESQVLYELALAKLEAALGPDHPTVALSTSRFASLKKQRGDYRGAERAYLGSLAKLEAVHGPNAPVVSPVLHNLGGLYRRLGDDEAAAPLYERAYAITAASFGDDSPLLAQPIGSLAELDADRGQLDRALEGYERALALRERSEGADHPGTASTLHGMAYVLELAGETERARVLYRRSLEIRERVFGPDHPDVAITLDNLGVIHQQRGELAAAEPLYRRSLAVREAALGGRHPKVARSLSNLASLAFERGQVADAFALRRRALAIEEEQIKDVLAVGSARRRRVFLANRLGSLHAVVTAQAAGARDDPQALALALETVLRRKGRELDSTARMADRLRESVDDRDREALDEWVGVRAELSNLTLAGPGELPVVVHRSLIESKTQRAEALEQELSQRSAEFGRALAPVTVAAVQARIPEGAALVEWFVYVSLRSPPKPRPPRYVAWVLHPTGPPLFADLGESETLDAAIGGLREELSRPTGREWRERARQVDALAFEPLVPLLGNVRHLLAAPDGMLQLVPLGALVGPDGVARIEDWTFTTLTTGRDLLALDDDAIATGSPWVVAAPDFDAPSARESGSAEASAPSEAGATRSRDWLGASFPPLPGTRAEAEALRAVLPGAQVLVGRAATESAVKGLASPWLLHIATHGYFLPDQSGVGLARGASAEEAQWAGRAEGALGDEDPLLRAGLAFSGANQLSDGQGEDGILTALEASSLDLRGTQLVVLSACETGLGEVRLGEGVHGLRRSLVLAGARSQLMSLWKVDDDASRVFVEASYRRLLAGEGRSDAVRHAQLELREARPHPYYWAAFTAIGDWRPLAIAADE